VTQLIYTLKPQIQQCSVENEIATSRVVGDHHCSDRIQSFCDGGAEEECWGRGNVGKRPAQEHPLDRQKNEEITTLLANTGRGKYGHPRGGHLMLPLPDHDSKGGGRMGYKGIEMSNLLQ